MSSSVCQGLKSCLEVGSVEPHFVTHKWPPTTQFFEWVQSPSKEPQHETQKKCHNENNEFRNKEKGDMGGWSFLQALTNTSTDCKQVPESDQVYVHPLVKRSSSMLSTKSLEMCTESLGSETGSGISESSDELTCFSQESPKFRATQRPMFREFSKNLSQSRSRSFPPPLSSIRGYEGALVRPHREDGRLVLKAVTVSSCTPYFQAERVDGRLRLCLLKEFRRNCDKVVAEEIEEVNRGDEAVEEHEECYDGDGEGDDYWDGDIGGKGGNVGCEIEIGELPRPSRCKESGSGNKVMSNWGPLCVAIS